MISFGRQENHGLHKVINPYIAYTLIGIISFVYGYTIWRSAEKIGEVSDSIVTSYEMVEQELETQQ